MKILLIGVPHHYVFSRISKSFGKTPPISLASLAAFLLEKGFETEIFDPVVDEVRLEDIPKYLSKIKFDAAGISSFTPALQNCVKILEIAKSVNSRCVTIMGGAHITVLPYKTMLDFPAIDYGVIGEGEITLFELMRALAAKADVSQVKGIIYRDNGLIKSTLSRERITDLDILPFPAYQLLSVQSYTLKLHHLWAKEKFALRPYMNIFTSRGCSYNCSFCGMRSLWGDATYYKSSGYVLAQIDLLVKKYNIKAIEISDSCFLSNSPRLYEILDGLIKRNYCLNFTCMARVDNADEDILRKLKQAKFRLIRFGVESGNQRMLDVMNKGYKIGQIKEAFELARKVDIPASACIIIGYPGETKETFDDTLKILKEIKPIAADFYIAVPLIGTKLYEIAVKENYISTQNWEDWMFIPQKPVLNTPYLSSQQLKSLLKKAYINFYFNPRFIFQCLKNLCSFQKLRIYFTGVKTLISILLRK